MCKSVRREWYSKLSNVSLNERKNLFDDKRLKKRFPMLFAVMKKARKEKSVLGVLRTIVPV